MPTPNYANLSNCRARQLGVPKTIRRSGNVSILIDVFSPYADTLPNVISTAGHRIVFDRLTLGNPIGVEQYSKSGGRVVIRRGDAGDVSLIIVIEGTSTSNLLDRWLGHIRVYIGGDVYDFHPQYPYMIETLPNSQYREVDTKYLYPDNIIGVDVMGITADMFDLSLSFTAARPNLPLFVDIPDSVLGQGTASQTYRIPADANRMRLDGYVDNRVLGTWKFSLVTPNSLPVFEAHAHFEPFLTPVEMTDLVNQGVSVYIDEFGLVHFPSRAAFERYFLARHSGDKFSRGWIASKPYAKGNYASVAADLPDKLIASKSAMVANYTESVNSQSFNDRLQRYKAPDVLAELHGSALDDIVELNQEKVKKLVRSVEKKRTLADKLNAIVDYYRNDANSTVELPAGIPDSQIRSLVSQPLSKQLKDINENASDADIAEMLAPDLIARLGFQRRVIA